MITVTLITGDGIGPEIAEAAKRCIDATGVGIKWELAQAGVDVMAKTGNPLPQATIDSVRKNGIGLKAPITTPVGTGFRSINVFLRQELELYACLRPCKSYKGVRSRYENIDLVIVRENTEDLYAGIEFEKGKDDTIELINWLNKHSKRQIGSDSGISIKPISVKATQKIVRFAFEYARKYKREKVTSVHKANIMKYTDGLWLETSRQVAKNYPDIEF
jgi:isocitrate dehydrogenase (NAD+)